MTNLRYPNNYFKNRSQGIRFKLEKDFLNKLQYYVYEDILPILKGFAKTKAQSNNPDYFNSRLKNMQKAFAKRIEDLAKNHFRNILKLSLTEKYGAWHKVPPQAVSQMLNLLWKQSKYKQKSDYFARIIFQESKPLFKQSAKEWHEDKGQAVVDQISDLFIDRMSKMSSSIYTHSTYFINSAYEIQFKMRDPAKNYRYRWGTRPDNRRTIQCETINDRVNKEAMANKDKGVDIDRLEEIVDEVANMKAFKKANPNIKWTPHYNCRSGIERVV